MYELNIFGWNYMEYSKMSFDLVIQVASWGGYFNSISESSSYSNSRLTYYDLK